jgi:hypothetical protein
VQVCVRRQGAVVLDRAIGHAGGNGPRDDTGVEKEPATPAMPFIIYSASKAVTAFVVHMLHERGRWTSPTASASTFPDMTARQGRDHNWPGARAPRRGAQFPREALDLDRALDREFHKRSRASACRRHARLGAGRSVRRGVSRRSALGGWSRSRSIWLPDGRWIVAAGEAVRSRSASARIRLPGHSRGREPRDPVNGRS